MSFRDKLKKTKAPQLTVEDIPAFLWEEIGWTGDDVPISWDEKTLRQCAKNSLRTRFKRGRMSKQQYKKLLREL